MKEIKGRKLFFGTPKDSWPPRKSARQAVWCPSTKFKLQILILKLHQIFNISYFSKFYNSLKKNYLLPKISKNHPDIYKTPLNTDLWD